MARVAERAKPAGVTLNLEVVNRFETNLLNTTAQGLAFIEESGSDNIFLHLDTFHMNIEEKNQAKAIRKAGDQLAHLHACGSDRGTPGNDHIAWPEIIKALKAVKYEGDVVIESFTDQVKSIAKAAGWTK